MRSGYERKVAEKKGNQAKWQREKKRLEDQKEASWGGVLRNGKEAERNWKWWQNGFFFFFLRLLDFSQC